LPEAWLFPKVAGRRQSPGRATGGIGRVRGYFAVGVENLSKAANIGSLWRTAHAFGAQFLFTIATDYAVRQGAKVDTSAAEAEVPLFHYPDVQGLVLPRGCRLVGVEIRDDAVLLPSFRHPRACAYVFGRERGALTDALVARCDHLVRIPAKFAVNVGIAGAIVLYDRLISVGRFPVRPVTPDGTPAPLPEPVFGAPKRRRPAGGDDGGTPGD
jgi:tRNA G18 (ribose-2'-O)-methylase SpoU